MRPDHGQTQSNSHPTLLDENKGTLLENAHVFYCYVYDDVRTFQRKILLMTERYV